MSDLKKFMSYLPLTKGLEPKCYVRGKAKGGCEIFIPCDETRYDARKFKVYFQKLLDEQLPSDDQFPDLVA